MGSLIQGHPAVIEVDEPGLQLKLASREPTLFTTMQPSMDSQELIWFIDWNYIESNIFQHPLHVRLCSGHWTRQTKGPCPCEIMLQRGRQIMTK